MMNDKDKGYIIDVRTLQSLSLNGRKLSILDTMKLFSEAKVLLYDGSYGNPPIIVDRDDIVSAVDISKLTNDELSKIYKDYIE